MTCGCILKFLVLNSFDFGWLPKLSIYFFRKPVTCVGLTLADLRGDARDARPPWIQILSFSCSFQDNYDQIISWRPHLGDWRPLLWEILGSATDSTPQPTHFPLFNTGKYQEPLMFTLQTETSVRATPAGTEASALTVSTRTTVSVLRGLVEETVREVSTVLCGHKIL